MVVVTDRATERQGRKLIKLAHLPTNKRRVKKALRKLFNNTTFTSRMTIVY